MAGQLELRERRTPASRTPLPLSLPLFLPFLLFVLFVLFLFLLVTWLPTQAVCGLQNAAVTWGRVKFPGSQPREASILRTTRHTPQHSRMTTKDHT